MFAFTDSLLAPVRQKWQLIPRAYSPAPAVCFLSSVEWCASIRSSSSSSLSSSRNRSVLRMNMSHGNYCSQLHGLNSSLCRRQSPYPAMSNSNMRWRTSVFDDDVSAGKVRVAVETCPRCVLVAGWTLTPTSSSTSPHLNWTLQSRDVHFYVPLLRRMMWLTSVDCFTGSWRCTSSVLRITTHLCHCTLWK